MYLQSCPHCFKIHARDFFSYIAALEDSYWTLRSAPMRGLLCSVLLSMELEATQSLCSPAEYRRTFMALVVQALPTQRGSRNATRLLQFSLEKVIPGQSILKMFNSLCTCICIESAQMCLYDNFHEMMFCSSSKNGLKIDFTLFMKILQIYVLFLCGYVLYTCTFIQGRLPED